MQQSSPTRDASVAVSSGSAVCDAPPIDPKAGVSLGMHRQGDFLTVCAAWGPAQGDVRQYQVTFFFPRTGEEFSYEVQSTATEFSMPEPDWRVVSDDVTCLAYSTRGVRVEAISAAGSASVVGDLVVQSEGCGPGK
jgi:hypothetical protein